MNETIVKFGYPSTLIREWEHWVLLLRVAQPTLGSCILAAKSEATEFGKLEPAAHAELATVTGDTEKMLQTAIGYAKLNYLMLMMVDPHVHFHVIPRYEGTRHWDGIEFADAGWPKVPDLGSAMTLTDSQIGKLVLMLSAKA